MYLVHGEVILFVRIRRLLLNTDVDVLDLLGILPRAHPLLLIRSQLGRRTVLPQLIDSEHALGAQRLVAVREEFPADTVVEFRGRAWFR